MSVRQDLRNVALCLTEKTIFVCSVKIQLWNRLVFKVCSKNSCILAQMLPILAASGCLPSRGNRDQSHDQAVRMGSLLLQCPASASPAFLEKVHTALEPHLSLIFVYCSVFIYGVVFIYCVVLRWLPVSLPPSQELKCVYRWIYIKLEGLKQWFPLKSAPTDNCLEGVWVFMFGVRQKVNVA